MHELFLQPTFLNKKFFFVICTCHVSIQKYILFAIKTVIRPSNIQPAFVSSALALILILILIAINQNFIPFNFMATATKGEY